MEHEETYRGQRIIVTTVRQGDGNWSSKADLVDQSGESAALATEGGYPSEEEARQAALSLAVSALDRARTSKGKP